MIFFSPEGFPFSNSSGVFYLFKGYSNRAPSEITLYPLTSPWAGLIIGNLWQIALNKFWALQQTSSSCNNTVPVGPSWAVVLWASPDHVTCLPLGLLQTALCGLLLVCHNLGKKWASTTPRGETQFPVEVYAAKKLRTLLPLKSTFSNFNHVLPDILQHLTCLRALNLNSSSIEKLPDEVERLIHLRFIDLSSNHKMKELPETICNLYNLHTLDISRCRGIEKLPQGMGKLIKLRHLSLRGIDFTKPFPTGIGRLSSLRTLEQFIVSGKDDIGGCKLEELKILNHLQGALAIKGLGNVVDMVEAENARLKEKTQISRLRLEFDGKSEENRRKKNDVLILNVLEPHPNL